MPTERLVQIEEALAQTQCQLCDYPSCQAYAEAVYYQKCTIDKCLPGGEKTLKKLAALTNTPLTPQHFAHVATYEGLKAAHIVEEACIGCTKCIQACPVDAIIGSAKKMHSVLAMACNGCALCIPACPVDCIQLSPHPDYTEPHDLAELSKLRYQRKQARLTAEIEAQPLPSLSENRLETIEAALARANKKKKND